MGGAQEVQKERSLRGEDPAAQVEPYALLASFKAEKKGLWKLRGSRNHAVSSSPTLLPRFEHKAGSGSLRLVAFDSPSSQSLCGLRR